MPKFMPVEILISILILSNLVIVAVLAVFMKRHNELLSKYTRLKNREWRTVKNKHATKKALDTAREIADEARIAGERIINQANLRAKDIIAQASSFSEQEKWFISSL